MQFFDHKVLILLSFYTFSFAIFNSPYSTYVNNLYIVSLEVIRPLRRLCKGHITYSPYYISACNKQHENHLSQFSFLEISKLKAINHKSFYRLILILSGDINLNPMTACNHHPPNFTGWDIFKIKGLHLLHLNVNSLLPKIHELRYIAKLSNAVAIGITESKLDSCILDSEIQIDNYQILRCDRSRKGGVALRNDLSYIEKDVFPEEIENTFF